MTLVIVSILLIGYFLIATEHLNKLNKSSVAMFLGVVGWILYIFNGPEYVQSMHSAEYLAFLDGAVSTQETIKNFIASHVFMQYVMSACQVILFIIATSAIIEVLVANEVFEFLAVWMRTRHSKQLLWVVALVTFLLSAEIDNLTTAVIMVLVLRKLVPQSKQRFYYSCVILMAANAGGCFTAIGDVTSLILWTKNAITPSTFALDLALPAVVTLVVTTFLASLKVPDHLDVRSSLGKYVGDDYILPAWQRFILFVVGIGGLWAIPTLHNVTKLPPFVGALCVMSLLWVLVQLFTWKRMDVINNLSHSGFSADVRTSDASQILFFMGIYLAVGVVTETGALHIFANWCDTNIHNTYILTAFFGLVSSVLDNIPLVVASTSMYPVLDAAAVASSADASYLLDFVQNGSYWELLSFCTAMGGTLLTIGTVAGFSVASLERIPFLSYINRFSWMVLIGWLCGLLVYFITDMAF